MDFEIKTKNFIAFLNKIKLDKIIHDCIISSDKTKIFCQFASSDTTVYGEVSEPVTKIYSEGQIKVPSLDKLISIMNCFESEAVRIAANGDKFIVTDGKSVGKSNVKLTQVAEEEFVESFSRIKGMTGILDTTSLTYLKSVKYEYGFEVAIEILQRILKDAKAFGYDIYKFFEKDSILNCVIRTKSQDINDTFNRKLITVSKIGNKEINEVTVGQGFREIISAIAKDTEDLKKPIKLYFHETGVLLTDGNKFYYNISAEKQEKN